jgi:hypothetical protein
VGRRWLMFWICLPADPAPIDVGHGIRTRRVLSRAGAGIVVPGIAVGHRRLGCDHDTGACVTVPVGAGRAHDGTRDRVVVNHRVYGNWARSHGHHAAGIDDHDQ